MIAELRQIGMTQNEAKTYVASVKIGSCSVKDLSEKTGLNRITVHSIVEKFEKMGIFVSTYDKTRRRISPVDPDALSALVAEEEEELKKKRHSLGVVLPTLREMHRRSGRGTQLRTLSGISSLSLIYDDIIRSGLEVFEYATALEPDSHLSESVTAKYVVRKRKAGTSGRLLCADTEEMQTFVKEAYMRLPESSPIKAKIIAPPSDRREYFAVYGKTFAMFDFETEQGSIIEDASLAALLGSVTEMLWNSVPGEYMRNGKG